MCSGRAWHISSTCSQGICGELTKIACCEKNGTIFLNKGEFQTIWILEAWYQVDIPLEAWYHVVISLDYFTNEVFIMYVECLGV